MSRDLCIMACCFCREPAFHEWMRELSAPLDRGRDPAAYGEEAAKTFILSLCEVESRSDLDTNPLAAARFHQLIREPFVEWKEAQSESLPVRGAPPAPFASIRDMGEAMHAALLASPLLPMPHSGAGIVTTPRELAFTLINLNEEDGNG